MRGSGDLRHVSNRRYLVNGVHTEEAMGFESFTGRLVGMLVERGADVVCFVVDVYRRRRRLLVSLGKRLQQQTVCRRATVQVLATPRYALATARSGTYMRSLRTRPGIATALVASDAALDSDCLIKYLDQCLTSYLVPLDNLANVFATPKLKMMTSARNPMA